MDLWNYFESSVLPTFLQTGCKQLGVIGGKTFMLSENSPVVVKFNRKDSSISFILSKDWVTAMEPEIHGILTYTMPDIDNPRYRKGSSQIYHSKELFVGDNYNAFDVVKANQRTKEWNTALKDVSKSKIGYKNFWITTCREHGLDVSV